MPFDNNGKHVMLNALAAVADNMSLHTASPASGGANEVSGGSPAYARQATAWNSAASGEAALTANETFDVPASTTVAFVGLFSDSSGGTWYGYMDVTDEVFGGQGTYTVLASGTKLDINDS